MRFAASSPYDGTLTTFYVLAEDFCYTLPAHVSLEEGVLVEPLAVAVHMARLAGITIGTSVIVFGAGPVGLLCGAVAKAMGANPLVMVDVVPARVQFAATYLGAAVRTFTPDKAMAACENAQRLKEECDLGE